jgi:alpha-L-fucosidase 2
LPALPDEWKDGAYKGVVARGGFELDFEWKDKRITRWSIKSKAGGVCRIADKPNLRITCNGKIVENKASNGIVEFNTDKGGLYSIE